jgi:periplasmic protein TonB
MRFISRLLTAGCALGATVAIATAQDAPRVYEPGNGVSLPVLVMEVRPQYTQAAMDAHIQGTVLLAVVVEKDGNVGAVSVTRSLDTVYGLDEQATNAAKQWTFKPGTKDGEPVAVRVHVELAFTLK